MIGELFAFGTACGWTTTSLLFASAGREVGSGAVNAWRLVGASAFLGLTLVIMGVMPSASLAAWGWLGLSALLGLAIGDGGYFTSLVLIGPRRAALVFSVAPLCTALVSALWLGEWLLPWQLVGMGITIAGIAWVLTEPDPSAPRAKPDTTALAALPHTVTAVAPASTTSATRIAATHGTGGLVLGVFAAFLGAAGQGTGIVVAKYAMDSHLSEFGDRTQALVATSIRMFLGMAIVWAFVATRPRLRRSAAKLTRSPRAAKLVILGAFIGPFVAVWMSLEAVRRTEAAPAMTIMALVPILVIPAMALVHRERPSVRAIVGAGIAVSGVAVLVSAAA